MCHKRNRKYKFCSRCSEAICCKEKCRILREYVIGDQYDMFYLCEYCNALFNKIMWQNSFYVHENYYEDYSEIPTDQKLAADHFFEECTYANHIIFKDDVGQYYWNKSVIEKISKRWEKVRQLRNKIPFDNKSCAGEKWEAEDDS